MRSWVGTLRYRYGPLGPNLDPRTCGAPHLYAFWHEYLLLNRRLTKTEREIPVIALERPAR